MRRLPRPRIRGDRRFPGRRAVLRICAWAEVIVLSQCRISLDDTDKRILNAIQMDFPLVQKPFDELGKSLGLKEEEVISRIKRLQKEGAIRRIGPIISTKRTGGMSTLVAMKVPPERVEEVSGIINEYEEVSHNYLRPSNFNIWFTLSAESK